MKRLETLKRAIFYMESEVYTMNFSQFTIDFAEEIDDAIYYQEDADEQTEKDLVGSIEYKIHNILEIMKPGPDRELFCQLQEMIAE